MFLQQQHQVGQSKHPRAGFQGEAATEGKRTGNQTAVQAEDEAPVCSAVERPATSEGLIPLELRKAGFLLLLLYFCHIQGGWFGAFIHSSVGASQSAV